MLRIGVGAAVAFLIQLSSGDFSDIFLHSEVNLNLQNYLYMTFLLLCPKAFSAS